MKERPLIVACVPAFNEEKTIARVVLLAQKYADRVIVCDDGSMDFTAEIAERLGAEVVRHGRRLGYGAALRSLFGRARELGADVLVTLDGDGQHNPGEIKAVVGPILSGEADIVVGSRFLGESDEVPFFRRLGIKAITRLTGRASGDSFSDAQSGFRAYNKKAVEGLRLNEDGMGVSAEILLQAEKEKFDVVEVPVNCRYRGLETSKHSPLRHGVSVIMSIVRLVVEEKPLIFLGIPGAISLLIGMFFGAWMLQIYAAENRIVTNIALASIAFILIGMFAIFTGITLYAITRLTRKINSKR